MIITKKEAIDINNTITYISDQTSYLEDFSYEFLRNKLLLKSIVEEYNVIFNFIKEKFKVEYNIDSDRLNTDSNYSSETDVLFIKYNNEDKKLNDFLEEKVEVSFITIGIEELKKEKFKLSLIYPLIDKIILTE